MPAQSDKYILAYHAWCIQLKFAYLCPPCVSFDSVRCYFVVIKLYSELLWLSSKLLTFSAMTGYDYSGTSCFITE